MDIIFREMILPGAFDGLIDTEDIVALYNHDEEAGILARSIKGKGTLTLSIDDYGLKYSFEAPDTSLGNDVLESVRRGDLNSNSFVFLVAKDGYSLIKQADGTFNRMISKVIKLRDISLVVRSAYPDAIISSRALEQIEQFEVNEMEEYYKSLKQQI